ncbi:MAG: hypothetical protein P4L43_03605 [Syntrophobacteraceae bacterium]|nr:hypothetical protein [Syntrophobacteraceae bacterium]
MVKLAVIRDSLVDVLGVEETVLQRIERHLKDERVKKYPRASEVVEKIRGLLTLQACELEVHLSSVDGGFETKLKKTATSFMGAVAYIYERFRTNEPVSKSLRDYYTLLNHAVIGYGMLHTTVLAFNEEELADMARRHMAELAQLVLELSEVIPFVLASELAEETQIKGEQSIAQQAVVQYREAWARKATL